MGKKIFLSYAEEDSTVALKLAKRLTDEGLEVYYWQDRRQRGKRFIDTIGREIAQADIFIACLSDSFLNSTYCQIEGENAIGWENDAEHPRKDFIVVTKVGKYDGSKAGLWRAYDFFDLVGEKTEEEISNLLERVNGAQKSTAAKKTWPSFQNRVEELDDLLAALRNTTAGDRFFLILSGPQMGKSWLLEKVEKEVEITGVGGWHMERLELKEYSKAVINDPAHIVGDFFKSYLDEKADRRNVTEIVKAIARSRCKWLCILDGAELLNEDAATQMRDMLSQIYNEVKKKVPSSDFAFMIASRIRHDAWRGILPSPRFKNISLSHFELDVIKHALQEMTQVDDLNGFKESWYDEVSLCLQKATEGLPALLVAYMQWIRDNAYVFNLQEIEDAELFEKLAKPYITDYILSVDGLLLSDDGQGNLEGKRKLLEQVLLGMAAYRVFSISNLDKVLDDSLHKMLTKLGWTKEDLWQKLLDTTSIDNATPDIWKKTYMAVRRLLFRYKYEKPEDQAEAHREAGQFYDGFWNEFSGTDKAIVLVERLWHQVEYERLANRENVDQRLVKFAEDLFRAGVQSNHHTKQELSEYLVKRIADDKELIVALKDMHPNLFASIIQAGQNIKEGQHEQLH